MNDEGDCIECSEEEPVEPLCVNSQRPCGHHCNHAFTHDTCCWCLITWGEGGEVEEHVRTGVPG